MSGVFHLIFSDHGGPWVTETTESENMNRGTNYTKKITTQLKLVNCMLYELYQ